MDSVVHAHDKGVLVRIPHRKLFKYQGEVWLRDSQSMTNTDGLGNLPWRPISRRSRSIALLRRNCMATVVLFYPARPKGDGACDLGNPQRGRQSHQKGRHGPMGPEELVPYSVNRGCGGSDGEVNDRVEIV